MAVFTIGGIMASIGGVFAWFSTLPPMFKYIIFLAGLTADAGLVAFTGFGDGIVATPINLLLQHGFGLPIVISSWQLLIVFIMLPIMFYCLKN